ncbi:hypothetical protein VTN77DRAFT_9188 [Rasamsonia byssochlamydoides]|uniref:uncharacterized protein n=1 Tax=Rasamsonia byssochlamydoides TaxID=89139 RepID=UPI00374309C4
MNDHDDNDDNNDATAKTKTAPGLPVTVVTEAEAETETSPTDSGTVTLTQGQGEVGDSSRERSRGRVTTGRLYSYNYHCPTEEDINHPHRHQGLAAGSTPPGGLHRGKRRRPRSPGLKWRKDYSEIDPQSGRVLLIDFAKNDNTGSHIRKVTAQEIYTIEALRRVYTHHQQQDEPALRIIHVQNAPWATQFLLRKFNIESSKFNRHDLVGTDFGRYVRHRKPEQRGGKPLLNGKTWKVQYDPWRGIGKTSFGLDYVKTFRTAAKGVDESDRLVRLNSFDENDELTCRHDVYVQRVSCYIQHKLAASEISSDDVDVNNSHFYGESKENDDNFILNGDLKDKNEYIPPLRTLDNGNVIIIFDNSYSGSMEDTLIPARREWECRWRRLPFYLAFESRESVANDEQLAVQCTKSIISDVFKAVIAAWDGFLDQAVTHVSILEDKIYDQPADETRAPELWSNSSLWLKVEKLLNVHIRVMHEMKSRLHELTDDVDSEDNWLDDIPGEFDRLTNLVTEDLVKPTGSLISLVYQSVSIRDSRHSLELGASMWRLSWITFIFLPLTFIVGFFGMNVDTFANNPSIKWYFIAAIPFMIGVVAIYFVMKRIASRQRQTLYQRGVYENFFQEMATTNPTLWSRSGPREYVVPKGRIARLKWALIRSWLRPDKTIRMNVEDDVAGGATGDGLGVTFQIKRYLSRRWTEQIQRSAILDTELGLMEEYLDGSGDHSVGDGLVEEAAAAGQPVTTTDHDPSRLTVPEAVDPVHPQGNTMTSSSRNVITTAATQHQRQRRRSSSSDGSKSGIMVEEEDAEWLHERGKQGKEWLWRKSAEREKARSRSRSASAAQEKRQPSQSSSSAAAAIAAAVQGQGEGETQKFASSSSRKEDKDKEKDEEKDRKDSDPDPDSDPEQSRYQTEHPS